MTGWIKRDHMPLAPTTYQHSSSSAACSSVAVQLDLCAAWLQRCGLQQLSVGCCTEAAQHAQGGEALEGPQGHRARTLEALMSVPAS